MSRTLEVRCCCQPRKLVGWLDVPDDDQPGYEFWTDDGERVRLYVARVGQLNPSMTDVEIKHFKGRVTRDGLDRFVTYEALKAEAQEETVRRIVGFRPNEVG